MLMFLTALVLHRVAPLPTRGHSRRERSALDFLPFVERLMFSAAARDAALARHTHLFGSRLIGPLRFLNPLAVARAAVVNVRHRSSAGKPAHPAHPARTES
ncbi:hypothetical protein ACWGB8_24650 [Kitasatospora sp. NPDC054939]